MDRFLKALFVSIFFFSCSSDLDLDQANDLKLEPVLVANLATFDIQANQFVVGGVEQPLTGDVVDFLVFNDPNFADNIKKVEMYFEFNNTINRAFSISLILLDANDARLYTIPFLIPAYTGTSNVVKKTEIFENASLDILKKTEKIAFVIALLPGPTLTDNSLGTLKHRSSGTLYFEAE